MDFSFSEQQIMLRTTAKDFLGKEQPKTKTRMLYQDEKGYDQKLWKDMAELGWQGLVLPEEFGGVDGGFLDLVILFEEMGRNIVPGPFFPTVALCALPILGFGTTEQKSRFLPSIATGEAIWSLALIEESASYNSSAINMTAITKGDHYILNGCKIFVPAAHIANYLLVAARTGKSKDTASGITLFIMETPKSPGVKIEHVPTIAGDRKFNVTFDNVEVPKYNVLGSVGEGWKIIDFIMQRAAILKCAEISGACQAVLDMTSAYAKDRIQFDRPIAAFQAVQHKLADMVIDIDAIQYLLYQAAWGISIGEPNQMHISFAKAKAAEAYQKICIEGITTHGAIGFTMDCDIGLYYLRVREAEFTGGNTDMHIEKIAAELGL